MLKAPPLYKTYTEIPLAMKKYMTDVANVKDIMEIPLEDINIYLESLGDYEKSIRVEYEDGWVL